MLIFVVSLCGLISDEGWLMVFVIATIEKTPDDENAELAVKILNELVPIQQLTGLFVGSKCATYAEKPKVFFFLDFDADLRADGPTVCLKSHSKLLSFNVYIFFSHQYTNNRTFAVMSMRILGFLLA
jgi:hypothetical protein